MPRYTKAERIKDLVEELNQQRAKQGKLPVTREWTGCAHWLKESRGKSYCSMGGNFVGDDRFIGFLEGLIFAANNR